MAQKDKIELRRTTWFVVNIKARKNQKPSHYVEAFRAIKEKDPLIEVFGKKCISIRSMIESECVENDDMPKWIQLNITHYTIVDPSAFYNIREHKDVDMEWNTDIVANKHEAELYFIPSVHMLAVKRNSKISLNNVLKYLQGALEDIEPEGFDVSVVLDHDLITRILSAHAIYSYEAQISYSNPGHSKGFAKMFEDNMLTLNPNKFSLAAVGTEENPLVINDDGIIEAATRLAEENGSVKATIVESEGGRRERVDSKDHPRILVIPQIVNGICSTVYHAIMDAFKHHEN
jgi:hypothetical protein